MYSYIYIYIYIYIWTHIQGIVHMLTSYLLLIFWLMRFKYCNTGRSIWIASAVTQMLKNKPHLITFHENILFSLWTFQPNLIYMYVYIYIYIYIYIYTHRDIVCVPILKFTVYTTQHLCLSLSLSLSIYIYICIYMSVHTHTRYSKCAYIQTYNCRLLSLSLSLSLYIYIYIYMCVCVCVCAYTLSCMCVYIQICNVDYSVSISFSLYMQIHAHTRCSMCTDIQNYPNTHSQIDMNSHKYLAVTFLLDITSWS